MAFNTSGMPSFLSRFLRPFSNTTMNLQPESLSAANFPEGTQRFICAAGCFWGVEHLFRKHFGQGKGLLDARVGYTGGKSGAPTYRTVCSGTTGHAEALLVWFDPSKVSYRQMTEFFYKMHDASTLNRQGMDMGTQYRSAIFADSDEQLKEAKEITAQVSKQWYKKPVSTEVTRMGEWYDAEQYHQLYLDNNPGGYECPAHFIRNFGPLTA